jgi:VanZ family protein
MLSLLFSIPQWLRATLSLAYLVLVAFLSLLPPNDFPELPLFAGADKVVHTCMYLGLTWLACWAMHAEIKNNWYYLIVFLSISWGVIMECFQFLMHLGRSFDFYDMISNTVGTVIGVTIYIVMAQLKRRIDTRRTENQIV